MKSLSSILRTNLIPTHSVWIAEGIGAALAASVAVACGPDLWLVRLTAALVALALGLSSVSKLLSGRA